MKVNVCRFNLFLALLGVAVVCGCKTSGHHQPVSTVRVHIESPALGAGTQSISVLRSDPVLVTISQEPILTEANVVEAKLFQAPGGFAIDIQFDEEGAWILEQYSAANPGKHLVIFGQWEGPDGKPTKGRWLSAPLITQRISDGILSFTPDMSQDEAGKWVLGLNNVAKKDQKGQTK